MATNGLLFAVRWQWDGTELSADASLGDTVLQVMGANTISVESSVWVQGSGPYTVTEIDPDTGTITLGVGLDDDYEEGSEVVPDVGGQPGEVWVAEVMLPDAERPIEVPLTVHDLVVMPEGVYDPPVGITLSDDLGSVVNLLGQTPTINGVFLDPTTVPDQVPTDPPDSSPSVAVTPTKTSFIMVVDDIAQTSVLDYYVDGVLHPQHSETRATTTVIESLPNGDPFVIGIDYTFHVVAKNAVGSAAPGSAISAQLLPPDSEIDAELVLAKLNAALIMGRTIRVGNIEIDADHGITIPQLNSTTRSTRFPADGSPSEFGGDATVDSLTVNGNLAIWGKTNRVEMDSSIEFVAGVSAPSLPPTAQTFIPTDPIHEGFAGRGLAYHAYRDCWYMTESLGTGVITTLSNTSPFDFAFDNFDMNSGRPEITSALGGVAVQDNGGEGLDMAYTLCQTNEGVPGTYYARWYVYQWRWDGWAPGVGSTWTFIRRWLYEPGSNLGGNSASYPMITLGGSNVYVAQAAKLGRVHVTRYSLTGTGEAVFDLENSDGSGWNHPWSVRGFVVDAADAGATRWWLTFEGNIAVHSVNPATERRVPAEEWGGISTQHVGLAWYDGRFLLRTSTLVYRMSKAKAAATHSITFTWRKSDGSAETSPSPVKTLNAKARSWVRVETPTPIPTETTADAVRFYFGNELKASPAADVTTVEFDDIPSGGAASGSTYGFPSGTSRAHSEASDPSATDATWVLEGAGAVRLGPWACDADGVPTAHHQKSGQKNTGSFSAINTTNSIPVVFDEPFPVGTTVDVVVSPRNLTNTYSAGCGAVSISHTGFTITAGRTSGTGAFDVTWVATPRLASGA